MVEIKKGHPLKAVLFDMDGVLFDSMKNHTLAWYRALSSREIPCERDERSEERHVGKECRSRWSAYH